MLRTTAGIQADLIPETGIALRTETVFPDGYYLNPNVGWMHMASNTLSIDGSDIAIGGRKRSIADIVAIASTASGIAITFRDGTIDLAPVLMPVGIVIISAFVGLTGGVLLVRRLYSTRPFDYIALRKSLDEKDGYVGVTQVNGGMKGREAKVFADMMPSGKVICDGRIYEATMTYGFAVRGETVRVVRTEQGRLYCEKIV